MTPKVIELAVDAEGACLGAMILSSEAVATGISMLSKDDFASHPHQLIFEAICHLFHERMAVDLATLKNELSRRKKLQSVGGTSVLIELAERVPSASNCEYYARQVIDAATIRRLQVAASEIAKISTAPDQSVSEMLELATASFHRVTAKASGNTLESLYDIHVSDEGDRGIPSGLPTLDTMLDCKGMPCAQTTIVQGATGAGKTPFLVQMATDSWRAGRRVFYASFADLSPRQLKRRMLKLLTGYSSEEQASQAGLFSNWQEAMAEVNDTFAEKSNFVFYDGRKSRSSGNVETFVATVIAEHLRSPIDLLVIDYLQVIKSMSGQGKFDQVMIVASEIEMLSRRLGENTATIVGSQLTEKDGRKVTRWSPEAENDAGLVVRLDREKGSSETTIVVVKNRFGNTGSIEGFSFDSRHLKFIDPNADYYG